MAQPFDAEQVRALADILVEANLTEIEVEAGDLRIRLCKTPAAMIAAAPAPAIGYATTTTTTTVPAPAVEPDDADHPGVVASPMVGIVYLTPEPGAEPFVTVGAAVAVGQTLCVIEAMKTFNQVKATQAGTVLRILVAGAEPVEYGQPLLIVA